MIEVVFLIALAHRANRSRDKAVNNASGIVPVTRYLACVADTADNGERGARHVYRRKPTCGVAKEPVLTPAGIFEPPNNLASIVHIQCESARGERDIEGGELSIGVPNP